MSIYVEKCPFLWIESILIDLCRCLEICRFLSNFCQFMSIYIDFYRFMSIYHVDLCQALPMSVEVADGGGDLTRSISVNTRLILVEVV